ncbi:BTAD domain-containing putative transcriptional regulator [Streptomyces sp. DH37]|uniref:BTAD domain-containing putative transcriptional regulator n=1 Tax=Streptomyces sp. DH37 TaxID=3040122 RepID=UPI002442C2A0|nr:BTAD domain-containing putative transcriptional regulator [Streptomyces sp. DH37]MDG9706145.1 BTAD domain-containing putative transcriptional regulator [Streptomyces sp. DH37]
MTNVEFYLLGPLEVRHDTAVLNVGPPKRRALLLRLLLENGRTIPVTRLCEDLWEGRPTAGAVSSVHAHISRLRTVLEPGRPRQEQARILCSTPTGYALRVPPEARDTVLFERAVERAQTLAARGLSPDALREIERAVDMWRGVPLADVRDQYFAEREVARLEQLMLCAEELRTNLLIREGRMPQAVLGAERLVERDPLREASWALLMRALYLAGRPAEALQRYEDVRVLLARDLGLDPGPALRETQLAVLRHETAVLCPPGGLHGGVLVRAAARQGRISRWPLVGRDEEFARLDGVLHRVDSGRTAWGVISGEPGVGKTRLAEELASRAEDTGLTVAWARCAEAEGDDPAVPLGPVDQLLRELRHGDPAPSSGPGSLPPAPEHELLGLLTQRPTLCVVEDVHHAGAGFRRLLAHWADTLHDVPLAVVCTVSDDPGPAVEPLLAALARRGAERVQPAALSVAAVHRLLRLTAEGAGETEEATGREACALHELSGGNPFFLVELLKLPADRRTGSEARTPPSAGSTLRVRLDALDPAVRTVLECAAVTGGRLDADVVARMCGLPADRVLELADRALAARLLTWGEDAGGREPGTYRFSLGLLRQVLLTGLGPARRQALLTSAARVPAPPAPVVAGVTGHGRPVPARPRRSRSRTVPAEGAGPREPAALAPQGAGTARRHDR